MFVGFRELRFAWGRFTLMGAVIALVAVLTVLLSGLTTGLVDAGISGLRRMPMTHLAFQAKTDSTFSRSTVNASTVRELAAQPGVAAEAFGLSLFNGKDAAGRSVDLALVGVQPDGFVADSIQGGAALGTTPDGVLVSQVIADDGVKPGDTITLTSSGLRLKVVGVAARATYGHVDLVYAPISLWREATYGQVAGTTLSPSAQGLASAAALRVSSDVDVHALAQRLGIDVVTKTGAYAGSPGYSAETSTMSLITAFLYVISALIVGAFFTVWTIQRRADIGLLKALGASTRQVVTDSLAQVLVVLVAAIGSGTALGVGLGALISGGKVPFSLQLMPVATAAGLLVLAGAVGSLVAVRRIATVDPLVALGASR